MVFSYVEGISKSRGIIILLLILIIEKCEIFRFDKFLNITSIDHIEIINENKLSVNFLCTNFNFNVNILKL